jgi:hypothetical protein
VRRGAAPARRCRRARHRAEEPGVVADEGPRDLSGGTPLAARRARRCG